MVQTALSSGDSNCPNGGVKVEMGLTYGNSTLDSSEVTATVYDCYEVLVSVDTTVGTGCTGTGTRLRTGIDNGDGSGTAGDGMLQDGEVDSTFYVCDPDAMTPAGFVAIPAGTFTMGSMQPRTCGSDETQHQVTLTSGFYMSDHEVTQARVAGADWQQPLR